MSSARKFIIRTLGCKANQYDGQLLREDLLNRGFVEWGGDGDVELCVINTCTVTAESDAKCRQAIRGLKRDNPDARIIVTGCYAHVNSEVVRGIPGVDAVLDNPSKETLAERVCELFHVEHRSFVPPSSRITFFSGHTRAFVKIHDGCDKRCSYCIVPLARGRSRSRQIEDIVREVEGLVGNGYREVVLTGIHIGSFGTEEGRKENRLPELLESLRGIEGLIRVRLSSIDPNEITTALVEAIGNSPQICRHLHVPLQSGSDAILRGMNRDYTQEAYLETVRLLKKELPGISVTTDVMVGFPGETDEDFEESRRAVAQAEFSKVHIFPFSSRPGTPAHRFAGAVPLEAIRERVAQLASDAKAAALKSKRGFRGAVVEVLVEREVDARDREKLPPSFKIPDKAYEGFSSNYLRTVFTSKGAGIEQLKNRLVHVRVETFNDRYLCGRQVQVAPPRA